MDRRDLVSAVFWTAIAVFVLVQAIELGIGTLSSPGPGFLLFVAGLDQIRDLPQHVTGHHELGEKILRLLKLGADNLAGFDRWGREDEDCHRNGGESTYCSDSVLCNHHILLFNYMN